MNKLIFIFLISLFFINCNNIEGTQKSENYLKDEFQQSIQSNQSQIDEIKFRIEKLKSDSMYAHLYKFTNPVSNISDSVIIQLDIIEKKLNDNHVLVKNNQKTELGLHLTKELNNYSEKIKNYIIPKSYLGKYLDFNFEEMNDNDFLNFYNDDKENLHLKILLLKNRIKARERELYFSFTSIKFEDQ